MTDLGTKILSRIRRGRPGGVWVPADFVRLASRDLVDKTLQRLVHAGELRRIDRGLYDRPTINSLTKRPAAPDYRSVIEAIARRDQIRILVDGMTAANNLGLTDAVPARVTLHTEAIRQPIQLANLKIEFKKTAPSRLYWAGRPAMRVVQALHWLKDTIPDDGERIRDRLSTILADRVHGEEIKQDLIRGYAHLPGWMQDFLRPLPGLDLTKTPNPNPRGTADLMQKRPRQEADAGENG